MPTEHIKFDYESMRNTADALIVINPRGHSMAEGIYHYMTNTALRILDETPGYLGYLSLAGFELCFWRDEDGRMNVRASVMAYSVVRFLKEKGLGK